MKITISEQEMQKLKGQIEDKMEDIIAGSAMIIESKMKKNCPVDTGVTRASIKAKKIDKFTWEIGSESPIAEYIEMGTGIYGPKKRKITPKRRQALHWKGRGGKDIFAKSVKGMPPRPFMRRSLTQSIPEIEDFINKSIS